MGDDRLNEKYLETVNGAGFVNDDFLKHLFDPTAGSSAPQQEIMDFLEMAKPTLAAPNNTAIPGIVDRTGKSKKKAVQRVKTASQVTVDEKFSSAPITFDIFETELQQFLLESGHTPSMCVYVACLDPSGPEPPILFDTTKYNAFNNRKYPFPIGGLGGLPTAGITGLQSIANQCPPGGRIVLVHGTHIGIDDRGSLGMCDIHDKTTDVFLKMQSCEATMKMYKKLVDTGVENTMQDELARPYECDLHHLHDTMRPYLSALETATIELNRAREHADQTKKEAGLCEERFAEIEVDKKARLEVIAKAKDSMLRAQIAAQEAVHAETVAVYNKDMATREARADASCVHLPTYLYEEQRSRLMDIVKATITEKAIVVGYIRLQTPPTEKDRIIIKDLHLVQPRSADHGWLIDRLGVFRSRCLNIVRDRRRKAEEEARKKAQLAHLKNKERNRRVSALARNTKEKMVEDDWKLDKTGTTPLSLQKFRGLAMYFRWSRIVRQLLEVVHLKHVDADWNLDAKSRADAKTKFGKLFMAMRWQSLIARYLDKRGGGRIDVRGMFAPPLTTAMPPTTAPETPSVPLPLSSRDGCDRTGGERA